MNHAQVIHEVKDNGYILPKPETPLCSNQFYNTMKSCWSKDPNRRPTFESLFNFFNDYFVNLEGAGYTGGE